MPINRRGASTTDQALSMLLAAADGYPFSPQTFGRAAWDAASGKIIDEDDARLAIRYGTTDLDHGFFEARW